VRVEFGRVSNLVVVSIGRGVDGETQKNL
jgi:hypothetical protein